MAKPNGPLPVEKLAAALQECLNDAAEKAVEKLSPRLDRQDATLARQNETLARQDETLARQDETLARQNATLRMMWTQYGGKRGERLPIDE